MAIPRNLGNLAQGADTSGVLGTSKGGTGLSSVGTNGQVLQSNGSSLVYATPSAGAMTLLNTVTASNSTSLADTTSLTSAYDLYMIQIVNLVPTNDGTLRMRVSVNGGSSYIGSQYNATFISNPSAGQQDYQQTNYIPLAPAGSLSNNSNLGHCATIYIVTPSSTTKYKSIYGTGAYWGTDALGNFLYIPFSVGGTNTNTLNAINAIQLIMVSGNIASGRMLIYGIKTS